MLLKTAAFTLGGFSEEYVCVCVPFHKIFLMVLPFLFPIGMLLLNFVCRDENLRHTVLNRLCEVFPTVMSVDIPQEVNRVIFASTIPMENTVLKTERDCVKLTRTLSLDKVKDEAEKMFKSRKQNSESCMGDVIDCLSKLTVLSTAT